MLKVRGGHRFEGYGNVKLGTDHGTRSGWQLTCSECDALSDVIHRTGSSFPPKLLTRIFSERGWKVGNTSEADVCPECLEKRRQKHREERKQYAKGSVDRLLDMIRQVDLMLASNVAIDYGPYQPQIAAQLKSLFETAYLCNMLPLDPFREFWKEGDNAVTAQESTSAPEPPPQPEPPEYELADKVLSGEMSFNKAREIYHAKEPEPPPPPSPPAPEPMNPYLAKLRAMDEIHQPQPASEPPQPASEPPQPASEPQDHGPKMSPRTAAFLAEVRRQVFKNGAAA